MPKKNTKDFLTQNDPKEIVAVKSIIEEIDYIQEYNHFWVTRKTAYRHHLEIIKEIFSYDDYTDHNSY